MIAPSPTPSGTRRRSLRCWSWIGGPRPCRVPSPAPSPDATGASRCCFQTARRWETTPPLTPTGWSWPGQRRAFSQATEGGIDVFSPVVVTNDAGETEVVVLRVFVPDPLLTDGVSTAWLVLALVAVVLVVVAVLATDRLARSVTRPSAELAATSRALARGDTHARATVAGPPEIADVAEAINLLADRIDELLAAERDASPTCRTASARRSPRCAWMPRPTAPARWWTTSTASRPR